MPFKKGQSKNPKGRPKGAQDKVSREARSLFIHIMEGEVGHIQDALDGSRQRKCRQVPSCLGSFVALLYA